jgi:hypothetical protein
MAVELVQGVVDVPALLQAGCTMANLHAVFPRGGNELWMVAHGPLDLNSRVQWGHVRDGEYVYVPVIPYRTAQDASTALKYAITLGLRAGLDANVLPGRDIKKLYLATGSAIEDLSGAGAPDQFRFYLGFAVQIH